MQFESLVALNHLIADPELTVERVARLVGYESSYAFSKTFKRIVGLAPSDYRKNRTHPLDQVG